MSLRDLIFKDKESEKEYEKLFWQGSFSDYLDMVEKDPKVARTSFQRCYDMILSHGTEEFTEAKEKLIRYRFFSDLMENGKDAIFGLEKPLMNLVNILKSAAQKYGPEKRIHLLHGPVGSSKSTIVRLLKKGLEAYTKSDEGRLYSYDWLNVGDEEITCPMHEEPLKLLPREQRIKIAEELSKKGVNSEITTELCPLCRDIYNRKLNEYKGDWKRILEDVRVKRLVFSEIDRVGIGSFQPKDEKNQDSTELTGDINYKKIAKYGSDSDPRAFNFDGEFNIANRGLFECIEILKLDVAFLYEFLGASQEHKVKPKKFPQIDIDEIIIGHTNEPELKKLEGNERMEAFRDRTLRIDIPYVIKLNDEIRIYERDYNPDKIKGKHIAPHTIEMASMWAVLTRLEEPKEANLTLMQKLKLYDGKTLPGFTEENVKELKDEAIREGMEGLSPRYIQDKLSNVLVATAEKEETSAQYPTGCANPFMLLNELEEGLKYHSLITSDEVREKYRGLIAKVKEEFEDVVKSEVQRAIAADEEALKKLCGNYIDNVKAYTQKEKVKNKYTGKYEEPDERLMKSIEEKIEIPESRKDDFRREIMNYIGALALDGKTFDYKSNERLSKALELKLFEDQKDSIKLSSLASEVVDKETQEKIDIVKDRLIKNYGYCEICARDTLNYVASIFARGNIEKKEKLE